MAISRFSAPRTDNIPSGRKDRGMVVHDLRGLDLVNPYDLIKDGRSPHANNFRLYAENEDSRRVVVSTRKGSGFYTQTLGEATDEQQVAASTGEASVGVILDWKAQKFVPLEDGRLTTVAPSLKRTSGDAPIVVSIHEDDAGAIGNQIAESGILPSDIGTTFDYCPAFFVESPLVEQGQTYWFVLRVQDNGTEEDYAVSTTTGTDAYTSSSGLAGMVAAGYDLNFQTTVSPDLTGKGIGRFTPDDGDNKTLMPMGTTMYVVDETDGSFDTLLTGLSSQAQDYNFFFIDGKISWVNGFDPIWQWDGTSWPDNADLVGNGGFETNTTGWTLMTGTTLTRVTTEHQTGVASMQMTRAASGTAGATTAITGLVKGGQYTVQAYFKGTAGQTAQVTIQGNTGGVTLTGGWDLVTLTFISNATTGTLGLQALATTSVYVDNIQLRGTGLNQVTHNNLPILRDAIVHGNRIYGLPAGELNKIVYSEDPGNDDGADNLWYWAWLSTSFIYIPSPKAPEPITGFISFQDSLTVFTTTNKYVLYGTDPGSYQVRQATGKKGAVSGKGIYSDANFIWFVGNDGFYKYNGSADELISDLIQPIFDGIARKEDVYVTGWRRGVRFYYPSQGAPYNDSCAIYHKVFEEWQNDTEVYTKMALPLEDSNDSGDLIELSSRTQTAFVAERNGHDMGRAIEFEYYTAYDSMGMPAQRKRILKFFPLLEGVGSNYPVEVSMDKDLANSPLYHEILMKAAGAVWGNFQWGDGTLWGGTSQFKPVKIRYSGYGYYWQLRIKRKGIDTPVAYLGHQFSFREKRL